MPWCPQHSRPLIPGPSTTAAVLSSLGVAPLLLLSLFSTLSFVFGLCTNFLPAMRETRAGCCRLGSGLLDSRGLGSLCLFSVTHTKPAVTGWGPAAPQLRAACCGHSQRGRQGRQGGGSPTFLRGPGAYAFLPGNPESGPAAPLCPSMAALAISTLFPLPAADR